MSRFLVIAVVTSVSMVLMGSSIYLLVEQRGAVVELNQNLHGVLSLLQNQDLAAALGDGTILLPLSTLKWVFGANFLAVLLLVAGFLVTSFLRTDFSGNGQVLGEVRDLLQQLGTSRSKSEPLATPITSTNDTIEQTVNDTHEIAVRLKELSRDLHDQKVQWSTTQSDLSAETEQAHRSRTSLTKLNRHLRALASHIQTMSTALKWRAQQLIEARVWSDQAIQTNADLRQDVCAAKEVAAQSAQDSGSASSAVAEITAHSKKIATFVATIEDIADQTNMLALNASIEANRAGEAGRGFAVVADEIGKLATLASSSTTAIASIVKEISSDSSELAGKLNVSERSVLSVVSSLEMIQTKLQALPPKPNLKVADDTSADQSNKALHTIAEIETQTDLTTDMILMGEQRIRNIMRHCSGLSSNFDKLSAKLRATHYDAEFTHRMLGGVVRNMETIATKSKDWENEDFIAQTESTVGDIITRINKLSANTSLKQAEDGSKILAKG